MVRSSLFLGNFASITQNFKALDRDLFYSIFECHLQLLKKILNYAKIVTVYQLSYEIYTKTVICVQICLIYSKFGARSYDPLSSCKIQELMLSSS